ncbi:hypothetical protein M885DRAFT_569265 [Pelagophyceae sp. CCMP2097]|nr:hypothetical protein M885DRAFT_569265 [Pelagophyceae sp. CCMP2097]
MSRRVARVLLGLALQAAFQTVESGKYKDYLERQRIVLATLAQTCEYKRYMLKADPICSNTTAPSQCNRELFVTGCGGTGTHAIHTMVQSMGVWAGVWQKATHEEPNQSPNVLVSWASRDGRPLQTNSQQYGRWGTKTMRKPMVGWAQKQARAPCLHAKLAHAVRHPLKVLASSVAFGQCVECWVHVEEFVIPPFSPRAARSAVAKFSGNGSGIDMTERIRRTIWSNRESKAESKMGGRGWSKESVDAILEGFALYWLAWNAMIAPVADYRFQIEKADYSELCMLAGVPKPQCDRAVADGHRSAASKPHITHGGDALKVSWPILDALDAELSHEVWLKAEQYGPQGPWSLQGAVAQPERPPPHRRPAQGRGRPQQ